MFHAIADQADGGEANRDWAVRGWPEGVSSERVAQVHRITQVALQAGCQVVPAIEPLDSPAAIGEPATHVVAEGRVWECCQWMPGQSPRAGDDLVAVLREAATGVARFHRAIATLGETHGPVPAVHARLHRLLQLNPVLRETILRSRLPFSSASVVDRQGHSPAVQHAVECLREVWDRRRERAVRLLEAWATRPLRQQYVLRDIHLENTLFIGDRLSGIIDYDAIRIDSPATDLARLVGSTALLPRPPELPRLAPLPWPELWSETLAAYRAVCPFSTEEEQLARVLAEVNPLVVLANWVVWVVREGRAFPGSDAAVSRRIEGWTHLLREQTGRSGRIQL